MKRLNTILVYDEGDTTFSKHAEQVMLGYPTSSTLFTTSRSSGVGAVVITHQPHMTITSLRSEADPKIIFNLSDADDARYMAQACSFSKEEQEMISKLPNYHAIVSTRRISRPFIIRPFNRADELRKKPIILKDKTREKIAELQREVIPREKHEKLPAEIRDKQQRFFPVGLDAIKLLENAYNEPFISTTERYSMLGYSISKGNNAVKILQKNGLINQVRVKTQKGRGNLTNLLEITSNGLNVLSKNSQPYAGKGGLKHAYYCLRINRYYEQKGYETKQEYMSCDVVVKYHNGSFLGIEVCIHTSNINDNISRNTENGFKTVLVFESRDALEKVKTKMQLPEDVSLKLIDEFLE